MTHKKQSPKKPVRLNVSLGHSSVILDGVRRPIQSTSADGRVTQWAYDGFVTSMTNPRGYTTQYTEDIAGRLISVTDSLSGETEYKYFENGAAGRLSRVIDAAGNTTNLTYDSFGRMNTIVDPSTGLQVVERDGFGRIFRRTIGLGHSVTTSQFDLLDRPLRIETQDGAFSTFSWDAPNATGALQSQDSETGAVEAFVYDQLGRLVEKEVNLDGESYPFALSYDTFGRLSNFTYPNDIELSYLYDGDGLQNEIQDARTGRRLWVRGVKTARGQTASETINEILNTDKTFNEYNGRVNQIVSTNSSGQLLQAFEYQRDPHGNVIARYDNLAGTNENFHYDPLDRLTQFSACAAENCPNRSVTYDAIGNITHREGVGVYSYDSAKPFAVQTAGSMSFAYDTVGNQVERYDTPTGNWAFRYNLNSEVQEVESLDTGENWIYERNANRDVIRTIAPDGSETIRIDGLFEKEGDTTVSTVHADGRAIARIELTDGVEITRVLLKDDLGSVVGIVDGTGNLVESRRYDPFGAPVDAQGSFQQSMATGSFERGFTGHRHHKSGLIDMRARWYDPFTGRMTAADPLIAGAATTQGWNRYSYVSNNPLKYVDPTGMQQCDPLSSCPSETTATSDGNVSIDSNDIDAQVQRYKDVAKLSVAVMGGDEPNYSRNTSVYKKDVGGGETSEGVTLLDVFFFINQGMPHVQTWRIAQGYSEGGFEGAFNNSLLGGVNQGGCGSADDHATSRIAGI